MIGSSKINVNQPVPNNPCLDRKPTEFERTPLPPQKKRTWDTDLFYSTKNDMNNNISSNFLRNHSICAGFPKSSCSYLLSAISFRSTHPPSDPPDLPLLSMCFTTSVDVYICMYVSYIRRINVYVICDIWKMMCIICLSTFVICVTCKWLIDDLITCNSHLIYSIHTIDSKGIWAADKGFGSCQMFVLTPETNVSVRKRFVFHKLTNLCWHPYCWLGVISFGGIP